MSLRPFLEISAVHLNDGDVELLEKGAAPMECIKCDDGFIVCTQSLLCEEEREDKAIALPEIGFSEAFIALTVHAARIGAFLIRFVSGEEADAMLPIDRPDIIDEISKSNGTQLDLFEANHGLDLMAGRYLECQWAEFAFIYEALPSEDRYWRVIGIDGCPNQLSIIRWVLDLATMEIVVLQTIDERTMFWEASNDVQRKLVSAELQQLRSSFAVHTALGVLGQHTAIPAWAHPCPQGENADEAFSVAFVSHPNLSYLH
ncbi:hypothetical protein [Microvirga tunisiensis]|uniref:Uncharacterized protein n=1 Tax=Microvirga tunisiensis TaxID=2108360 RepID=A0A5N7MH36_9HYPH|nr:hypothetical protein [Microvirga tunisiensis]MPR07798.1 hypothetical protein [Microvirga tunisiensis]MPR26193.1 hypothetical protein [Microvirga tunisiensis]